MLKSIALICLFGSASILLAQTPASSVPAQPPASEGLKQRPEPSAAPGNYQVDPGTRILLNMINSISTKQAVIGDRIYLETAFPILSANRIVIPQGSWVTGTITEVKRPGRMKGRGELQVRFDSLTLPNGVTRSFRADLGSLDARNEGSLKREQSKIKGPGDKAGDVGTVITTTAEGAAIGTGIGAASGHLGGGSLIGLAGGATAGIIGVLMTRGPEAILSRGSTVEMVLDRPLTYSPADLDLSNAPPHAALSEGNAPAAPQRKGWTPRAPF
jgi:type IV secretion system protein VirB10